MKNWRTFLLGSVLCANTAFAAPQEVDNIAAVVNNGVVLQSEVDNLLRSVKLNAQRAGQSLPDDTVRHQILERLIMDNIQLQIAERMGITITDQAVDRSIANIAAQNQMSLEQLRSRLASEGLSYPRYRSQIRKEMLIAQVRNNEVSPRVTILPQEVESLSKQIADQNDAHAELNVSHILIPLPEHPSSQQIDNAENLANKLAAEAKSGKDFGKLAIAYSTKAQALQEEKMGWRRLQELPTLFAERMQSANKGDIIGPLRSGAGFHLLNVNDRHRADNKVSVTEVHARHILLKPSVVMTDDEIRAKLQAIAQEVKSGHKDFADIAKQISQDPASALQGGDLEWASPDLYDPAFRAALLQLKKGEISGPVHSSFGWHLIQLLAVRQADKTDEAQKEQAYRILFNRKFSEEAQAWLQEQRATAYVKIPNGSYAQQ